VPLSKRSFISDRFFVGGIDSFRGFERNGMLLVYWLFGVHILGVGPRSRSKCEHKSIKANSLGGDVFYVGTAELSVPIVELSPMGDFRLHLFTQFGNSVKFDDEGTALCVALFLTHRIFRFSSSTTIQEFTGLGADAISCR
jgi:outer membrane protein assembly factor BamA